MKTFAAALCAVLAATIVAAAQGAPRVSGTVVTDFDHGLQFPRNKQNEPSIARDPMTGALIVVRTTSSAETTPGRVRWSRRGCQ